MALICAPIWSCLLLGMVVAFALVRVFDSRDDYTLGGKGVGGGGEWKLLRFRVDIVLRCAVID